MAFKSDIKLFRNQFEKSVKNLNHFHNRFLIYMANRAMVRAIRRTPVDTGYLKAMWFIGTPENLSIAVFNSAEYAEWVEFGRRTGFKGMGPPKWVPGKFMLTRAMDETDFEMETQYNIMFAKYLSGYKL